MFHVIDVFAESVTDSINFIVSWDENCEVVMTMLPLLLLLSSSLSYCWHNVAVDIWLIDRQAVGCSSGRLRVRASMLLPMTYERR